MELLPENSESAQELLNPQWQPVEAHFGVTLPAVLKQFYSESARVLQSNFDLETPQEVEGQYTIHVQWFSPISLETIGYFEGFERFIEIASDGGEGLYFIDPREDDPEVHLFVMDGYDLYPTGLCLSAFLTAPRLEPLADEEETSTDDLSTWPFQDSPATIAHATLGIMMGGDPIVHVTRRVSDGYWIFSSDKDSMLMVLLLRQVVARDPSIAELGDLPMGYEAVRLSPDHPWTRKKLGS